jgi:exopolysaccharide biosynthesis polyprenyl glycosylphosphotransferase
VHANRSNGIYKLHACIVTFCLLTLFGLLLFVSSNLLKYVNREMVHVQLYLTGIVISSLLSFHYYDKVSLLEIKIVRIVKFTSRQFLILFLVLLFIAFSTKDQGISRLFLGTYLCSAWLLMLALNRFLPDYLAKKIYGKNYNILRCILVGEPSACKHIEKWLQTRGHLGMQIIGMVTFEKIESGAASAFSVPILGTMDSLEAVIQSHECNQIILLGVKPDKKWVSKLMGTCDSNNCRVLVYNNLEAYFDQPLHLLQEGLHTFFTFKQEPLQSPLNQVLKRMLDILISLPVVVCILPFFTCLVWLMQGFQAPGALFFKQKRRGVVNTDFTIYKFRSMYSATDKRNRCGIYPFGSWIRKTSIDELPQFINVLIGDMSIVGPRPHHFNDDHQFSQTVKTYKSRHIIKPGITGLAQIKGFRGAIDSFEALQKRIFYDLKYIDNWSVSLDIIIIMRTFFQIFIPPVTAA